MVKIIELRNEFYNNFGLEPFKINNLTFKFIYDNVDDLYQCYIVDLKYQKEITFILDIEDIQIFYDNICHTLRDCDDMINKQYFSIKILDNELYLISKFNGVIKIDKNTANKLANVFNSIIINHDVIKFTNDSDITLIDMNGDYFYMLPNDHTLHYLYADLEGGF